VVLRFQKKKSIVTLAIVRFGIAIYTREYRQCRSSLIADGKKLIDYMTYRDVVKLMSDNIDQSSRAR